MDINKDKKVISELEIALTYYIKGLYVKANSINFISEVQRITEQALVTYSKIDIRKDNFLNPKLVVNNENIIIDLNNEHAKHSQDKKHIKIKIPYIDRKTFEGSKLPDSYILGGLVSIKIVE